MADSLLASIVINNYNYGHFLPDAIASALNQTYANVEVIVVDDGSTDQSHDIIASYGDRIIPVLKTNGGQASAFNAGFAASRGDIICFLDADDVFLPHKLADIVSIFRSDADLGWCFHPLTLVNEQGKTLLEFVHKKPSHEVDVRAQIRLKGKLPFDPPATSGLCFRRSLLQQILPMPDAIRITSDNYLKFMAVALSKGFSLNQNLACQRVHGTNAYTLRSNNQKMRAQILILTAHWMRLNAPMLSRFTHKLFARGISTYWRLGQVEADQREMIRTYLATLSLQERLEINSRAFYRYLLPKA